MLAIASLAMAQGSGAADVAASPAQSSVTASPTPETTASPTPGGAASATPTPTLEQQLKQLRDKVADFANLARYRDANVQLPAPAAGENRVVFMGDSITDNWGKSFGNAFPGKPYVNRGISGQTTPQMLIRFRPDVIALKPKVVVILAGTNDLAGNTGSETLEMIEDNLTSMAELARVNGIRVVLASVMPVCDCVKLQIARRPPEKILALDKWVKDYANKNGAVYLDYYSAMADDKQLMKAELTRDGLHPNAAGYAVMAPLAEKAIETALAAKPRKGKRSFQTN